MKKFAKKSPVIFEVLLIFVAFVLALIFGAIYIRTGDLCSVILSHAAIDITNRMFMDSSTTPVPVIAAFIVLLAAEAAYAFWLVARGKKAAGIE